MKLVISREALYELFLLCLFWQWNPDRLTHAWTTGGKVLRILSGLGLITEAQRNLFPDDRDIQSLFALKGAYLYSPVLAMDEWRDGGKRGWVLDDKRHTILIQIFKGKSPNRRRILRDYRIYMTHVGAGAAAVLEEKYSTFIDRDKYLAEVKKQEELLSPRARASVVGRYRRRVTEQVGE